MASFPSSLTPRAEVKLGVQRGLRQPVWLRQPPLLGVFFCGAHPPALAEHDLKQGEKMERSSLDTILRSLPLERGALSNLR